MFYVRVGGKGPAVLLLHGFGDTGDMWAPVAKALVKDHTVIVPDLRGMGLSSHPGGGYDKKTQGQRHRQGDGRAQDRKGRSGHARHRQHGRLCAGRAISGAHHQMGDHRRAAARHRPVGRDPRRTRCSGISISVVPMSNGWSRAASASISTASTMSCRPTQRRSTRRPAVTMRGSMRGAATCITAFKQFAAFTQGREPTTSELAAKGKLTMPVLALGGDHSFGTQMADIMRLVAANVTAASSPIRAIG